jgi:hypothetical protein
MHQDKGDPIVTDKKKNPSRFENQYVTLPQDYTRWPGVRAPYIKIPENRHHNPPNAKHGYYFLVKSINMYNSVSCVTIALHSQRIAPCSLLPITNTAKTQYCIK